jgi:cell division protein FtsI/penicillin-binding protein 2
MRSHRGFERVKLSNLTRGAGRDVRRAPPSLPGVDIQEALSRHYPFGEASAHAIGYVGSISIQDLERIDRSDYAGPRTSARPASSAPTRTRCTATWVIAIRS